ncbi:MAG: TonB family protein / TonB-dependent receptor [Polyangiaceae bacterium]|jgi:TonB family protein|nr:TonB family protein / TonB-dependent receptor [Polyangiaceae bacterium]
MLRVSTRARLAVLVCACQLSVAPSVRSQTISLPRPTQSPAAFVAGPVAPDATVSLLVTVGKDGSVLDAKLAEPGDATLDAAALEVVTHWTFTPATRDGEPVQARIRVLVPLIARSNAAPTPPAPAVPRSRELEVEREPEPALEHTDVHKPEAPREVTVVGHHAPPPAGASDLRLDVGELARVPRRTAAELLQLAPGIYLSNEGGEGHAERIYLRGFDAREGQDIELSVGGVPINESGNFHGNGFADTGFLIPELVHGLRVLEGPFDVRQGNYAVAGSADYEMGLDQRGLTAKYTLGSYDTHRALALFAPPEGATYAGAELYQTAGYGQNRDVKRARGMAQYEGKLGENGTFRLSAAAYGVSYHSAGVLRQDDLEAGRVGFFDTYDARQGGSGSRYHVSADLEQRSGGFHFGQQLFAIRRGLRLRENFTGFLLDNQSAIQSLHGQRGDLLDLSVDETTYGARGYAHTSFIAWGAKQDVEIGYFARGDTTNSQRQRVDAASIPYRTDVDLGANLGNLGLYGELTARPVRRVSVKLGARSDLFWYDVQDRCAVQSVSRPSADDPPGDASCLDQQRFGQHREPSQRSSTASSKIMPRATLTFGPFDHFSYSLSYGTGVRSIDPAYVSQDIATPFASIRAADGGVAYARDFGSVSVAARSIFFLTHVDRDLVFSETEGRSVLANGTTRTGWNGLVRLRGSFFDQNANISLVKSRFDDTGLLVPYSPDLVVRSDTALFGDLPVVFRGSAVRGTFSVGAGYVGHRALPYGQRSDTIFTLDSGASARWRAYEVELQVTNLLDSRYRAAELNYVSDFRSQPLPTLVPARHFAAGAPRAVFLSFAVTLGGEP